MTGHRMVPKSKRLEDPPNRTWWRCTECGRSWPFIPEDDDPCEGQPDDCGI